MKKLLISTAVLAVSAGIANAADLTTGYYFDLGAGWNHADEAHFKSDGLDDKALYDEGWVGDAALGYAWGNNFRTELEGGYRYNGVSELKGTGASGSGGNFNAWSLMANAIYDFKNNTPWTPYLGAGMGAAFEEAHQIGNVFAANTTINKSDTQFAYQGIVGIDYDLNAQSAWGVRYDYLGTTQGNFVTNTTGKTTGDYGNNAILMTYRHSL